MKYIILATFCLILFFFSLPNYLTSAQGIESQGSQQSNTGLNGLRNMMSVNVPVFYDMIKDGSSLGINVLQGLVKVERGDEAIRSGLRGSRPLSVKVFGIPVYERGSRIRNSSPIPRPQSQPNPQPQPSPQPKPQPESQPEGEEEFRPGEIPNTIEVNDDDELPIIP